MNARRWFKYVVVFVVLFLLGLCIMVKVAYSQESDCILVFDDNDEPGTYNDLYYDDGPGRDICKVRIMNITTAKSSRQ
jgi:hypothetical protein